MAYNVTKFGPGTLMLGETGAEIDISCQMQNAKIEWDKDKDDDVTVLCGDVVPGSTEYTATLTGTVFQDVAAADGLLFFSWSNKGQVVPFVFVPNTEAGTAAEGFLVIDPIDFGGDEPKANMESDFTWDCVGEPTLTGPIEPPVGQSASTAKASIDA